MANPTVVMAMLTIFPTSLMVSARLEPRPYISLGIDPRMSFTMSGLKIAPPAMMRIIPVSASAVGVEKDMIVMGRRPAAVRIIPIKAMACGLW